MDNRIIAYSSVSYGKWLVTGILVTGLFVILTSCSSIDEKFAEVVNSAVSKGLIKPGQAKELFSAWKAVGSVPWLEILGTAAATILGNTGIIRLWRGSVNNRKGNLGANGNSTTMGS